MRIFLSGATGLLGSHITEQLIHRGDKVVALVRAVPQKSFLGHVDASGAGSVELIKGDLEDLSWASQLQGDFDAVIHCAALASVDSKLKEQMWKINFLGTQSLYQLLRPRTKKWIQISSISTMCSGEHELVDETFQGQARKTFYAESKLATDQWLDFTDPSALIIHPCYMLGKWDAKPSSGSIFFAVKFKKIQTYHNSTKNFVAAQDVARGVLQALDRSAKGHFILGNENISLKLFFTELCREMNMDFELLEKPLNEDSTDWAKELCAASAVTWQKARAELSYNPQIKIKELLKETMDYFEEFKMLRRAKNSESFRL